MRKFLMMLVVLFSLAAIAFAHQVTLHWFESTTNVTFNVYRNANGGARTMIASGLNTTTYTDSSVAAGTTYTYVTTAVKGTSQSAFSAPITVTIPSGIEYYVSTSGNDSNNGLSPATAWRTVPHAIASFGVGSSSTIIHVSAGTYGAFTINRGGPSTTVRLVVNCDVDWNTSSGCKVSSGSVSINANNVDLVNFDIGNNASMAQGIIVPCNISTINVNCATGNSVHLLHNYVHDLAANADCDFSQGAAAILFNNQHGPYLTDPQAIGNKIARIGIQSTTNCSNNATAVGLYMNTGNFKIWNNVVSDVHGTAIQVYGYDCNGSISNNTIVRSLAKTGLVLSGDGSCPNPGSVSVLNNISDGNHLTAMQLGTGGGADCSSGHPILVSHNMFGGNVGGDSINGVTSCVTVSGTIVEIPASTFVSYPGSSSDDYHIKLGSLAINGGIKQCVTGGPLPCYPSLDIDSNTRPNMDIGAYSVGGTGGTPPPGNSVPPPVTGTKVTIPN